MARKHRHPVDVPQQGRPLKTRVFVFAVVAICAGAAAVSLFERKELPERLRDNAIVAAAYETRDRVIRKGEEWMSRGSAVEDKDAKQHGYEKDDRKKLDALISKGAQGND